MRQRLLVGLLGAALVAVALFPFTKSDARRSTRQDESVPTQATKGKAVGLPNFDVRLAGRREFTDRDLSTAASRRAAASSKVADVTARAAALDDFRAGLKPEAAANLRAAVNEAGAIKNLFIEGGALSGPQSDTPDRIARNFLSSRSGLFALTPAAVATLKRLNEDNDRRRVERHRSCGSHRQEP